MRGYLLDVNALIALLWTRHEHHAAAQRWFAETSGVGWATCSLTQLGFIRITTNPSFSAEAVRAAQAVAVLQANLEHASHQMWEDRWGAAQLIEPLAERIVGHRQVTDAYLLGLAAKYEGRLATLDGGIEALAGATKRVTTLSARAASTPYGLSTGDRRPWDPPRLWIGYSQ